MNNHLAWIIIPALLLAVVLACVVRYGITNTNKIADPIMLNLPIDFEGPILVANQGNGCLYENFFLLVHDLKDLSVVRETSVNKFVLGKKEYTEKPFALLYTHEPSLQDYGIWGKRHVTFSENGYLARDLKELKCGYKFALYYLGKGNDAKIFFDNYSDVISELIKNRSQKTGEDKRSALID